MGSYISTRTQGRPHPFTGVLLAGMAADGGLYVPDRWPELDRRLFDHLRGMRYADVALQVMKPFIGDELSEADLARLLEDTYHSGAFDHSAVAPLVQVGPSAWILELFHGPTLSFKDYALQFLGRLFDFVLANQSRRLTIVGATSGDTGSAAIEACRRCKNIDIFMLHPKDRISEVQRRQMTTVDAPNVFNIAVEGTFDDCQAIVKALFADERLRREINLSAVNSINWVRIMAQIVYYVAAALALGAPDRAVSFAVPTGNFGNVYAAYAARRMGLPISRLIIGTNHNDILTRFFETGTMGIDKVTPPLSPSMDIQISSNFERYLFELADRDHTKLSRLMEDFAKKKNFTIAGEMFARAQADFSAFRCSDEETRAMMKACRAETGLLIDPHTAVGLHAATLAARKDPVTPVVVVSTAHPAKFPQAISDATGHEPPMPQRLAALLKKAEHLTALPNDAVRIKAFIRGNLEKS